MIELTTLSSVLTDTIMDLFVAEGLGLPDCNGDVEMRQLLDDFGEGDLATFEECIGLIMEHDHQEGYDHVAVMMVLGPVMDILSEEVQALVLECMLSHPRHARMAKTLYHDYLPAELDILSDAAPHEHVLKSLSRGF